MIDDMEINDAPPTLTAADIEYDPATGLPILNNPHKMLYVALCAPAPLSPLP